MKFRNNIYFLQANRVVRLSDLVEFEGKKGYITSIGTKYVEVLFYDPVAPKKKFDPKDLTFTGGQWV